MGGMSSPASNPPDATIADAGEFGLIEQLGAIFAQGEHVLIGPGDDAAVLRIRNGHVVVSTDLMVEGRHFRRDWASAEDVGHRAAAQNLSDVNAMGGRATSLTVGLAAPAGADGLVLVPYLEGERTPNLPAATGSVHGLTLRSSTPAHWARAAVEGLLCGLADAVDAMRGLGIPVDRTLLLGGAARSPPARTPATPTGSPAPATRARSGRGRSTPPGRAASGLRAPRRRRSPR